MSKQTSRLHRSSKQEQNANKQSNNQSVKQSSPANKQTTSVSVKQNNSANKPLTRQAIKQERRQEERQRRLDEQRRAVRNKRILRVGLIAAAVVLIAAVAFLLYNANAKNPTSQNQATPTEQVVNPAYPPVNAIYCDALEQTAYHIHAHLTIYIDGKPVSVPQGVGIATDQSCLYWLHTHSSDGVIHIEAPKKVSPTLGDFLGIWGQPSFSQLGFRNELALSAGWTVYVDGKPVTSNFNQLVLQPHMVITLAYNSPNITPDASYPWQQGE